MTYSIDFRKKVLKIKEKEKMSFELTSKRFGVGKNTVFEWSKKISPLKSRNKVAIKIHTDKLKADIEQYSAMHISTRGLKRLGVSRSGIQKALKRLNITYKKSFKTSEGERRREIRISA
jgi:transposase